MEHSDIEKITAEELKKYKATHEEKEYHVIDVRQSEEICRWSYSGSNVYASFGT